MNGDTIAYGLEVRLAITKKTWRSTGPKADDGYWQNEHNDRLSVEENIDLGSVNFRELLEVLAQLHEAVKDVGK